MVVVRKMVLGYRLIFKSAACTISDLIVEDAEKLI